MPVCVSLKGRDTRARAYFVRDVSRSIPLSNRIALPFCSECIFRRHKPFRLSPSKQEDPSIFQPDLISWTFHLRSIVSCFTRTDAFNKYSGTANHLADRSKPVRWRFRPALTAFDEPLEIFLRSLSWRLEYLVSHEDLSVRKVRNFAWFRYVCFSELQRVIKVTKFWTKIWSKSWCILRSSVETYSWLKIEYLTWYRSFLLRKMESFWSFNLLLASINYGMMQK